MTLFFTSIPYAVTLTDGELVDENYSGHDPLVCEFCGVPMERIIGPDDSQHYQHVLHGQSAAIKAMHCKYRHYPTGGSQPYQTLKPPGESLQIPQWVAKAIPSRTITRKWRCVLCNHRYYGSKKCPNCGDWTCTLAAH
ncbi:putative zinc ribbon protein [Kluyvera ascorbata]|nr:putative zinc ribbon protein [Kluyvera ascorbata]